jgi:glucose-6-phosphate dehydrogenase assembly protein OpcA
LLWWTTDPLEHEALFRDLADDCSRLLLDLPDPGTRAAALRLGLDPTICTCSRDTAWFGLTRWRELVAQFFDPPADPQLLRGIQSLRIEALSPDPSRPPRLAIWLSAWLAGQLGWTPKGHPANQARSSGSVHQAEFEAPSGTARVEIETRPTTNARAAPCLLAANITTRGADGIETCSLARPSPDSPDVRISVEAMNYCGMPSIVRAPELEPARRVAAAFEASRTDPPFETARPIALWLLEQL